MRGGRSAGSASQGGRCACLVAGILEFNVADDGAAEAVVKRLGQHHHLVGRLGNHLRKINVAREGKGGREEGVTGERGREKGKREERRGRERRGKKGR